MRAPAYLLISLLGACASSMPHRIEWSPPVKTANMVECADTSAKDRAACLVRRPSSAKALRRIVRDLNGVVRQGNELTFAYEGQADTVSLQGGVIAPLSRLKGTNLWFVTIRIADIDRAIVNFAFFARTRGQALQPITVRAWRGPAAPPPAAKVERLKGRVSEKMLASRSLAASRTVFVYLPPERGSDPVRQVIYMGDGEAMDSFAGVVEALIVSGRIPRTMIVASHSAPDGLYGKEDGRALEYLLNYADSVKLPREAFFAHEQFFINELIPWAETHLSAPKVANQRVIGGFSNGGAFALQMALRHPGTFGCALAISPGGGVTHDPDTRLEGGTAFYLSGGRFEPLISRNAAGWADLFSKHRIAYVLREPLAGHDPKFWEDALADGLLWADSGLTR